MPTILVSDTTLKMLEKAAVLPWKQTATPGPNGMFRVWLADGTYIRLRKVALPGESEEDTIQRVMCEIGIIRRN